MASAASVLSSDPHPDVKISQQSVSASNVGASVTNGFLSVNFADESQQKAFVSGLRDKNISHTVVGLSVRFSASNRL